MQIVMVEFAVGAEKTAACLKALEKLMSTEVVKQPNFHEATIHEEKATGSVWNMMTWDTHQDFIDFRDGNAELIGDILGEFGPQGRMLDVAFSVEKDLGQ